jgi:hypothetical protein
VERKEKRGGRRPGAGRKPEPLELRQVRRVMVNLRESEHEELARAIAKSGASSVSDYIRTLVLHHLKRKR